MRDISYGTETPFCTDYPPLFRNWSVSDCFAAGSAVLRAAVVAEAYSSSHSGRFHDNKFTPLNQRQRQRHTTAQAVADISARSSAEVKATLAGLGPELEAECAKALLTSFEPNGFTFWGCSSLSISSDEEEAETGASIFVPSDQLWDLYCSVHSDVFDAVSFKLRAMLRRPDRGGNGGSSEAAVNASVAALEDQLPVAALSALARESGQPRFPNHAQSLLLSAAAFNRRCRRSLFREGGRCVVPQSFADAEDQSYATPHPYMSLPHFL